MRWVRRLLLLAIGYAALHWFGRTAGASRAERRKPLPGDTLVDDPLVLRTTHATTIDAPPDRIWPWLVQMGWHRGGWYTARWVDRLLFPANAPSADRIVPELQHLDVGSFIPDGPPGSGAGFVVESLEPEHHLVLRSRTHIPPGWAERFGACVDWTWAFVLEPVDAEHTRFLFRCRGRVGPGWLAAAYWLTIVPADLVMARQMMRGLRTRAERPRSRPPPTAGSSGRRRIALLPAPRSVRVGAMNRADAWRDRGETFSWRPRSGDAAEVQVFHVELGAADAPPLVLVHGFPTSSIDWFEIAERLSDRYRVCAMDFPGYGFSDKPLGWGYNLTRDAEVLEHYIAEVLGLESMIMLAHDRGSSVAMIHTTNGESRVDLEHLFITNANIFLPLSNLTQAQRLMLDPETGPALLAQATPEQLAMGMGQATYTPPRGADDPEIEALTAIFSHGEGLKVLHETIQYLVERSQDEDSWLQALAALDVPTTFIWGVYDTVSPPRVVGYVWNEYMMKKPGRNSLYFIPDANHYLQNDQPEALVETFLHALEAPEDTPPGAIAQRLASPLLVDHSRSALPRAADLLENPA